MSRGVMWHNGVKGLALVTRSGSHTLFKAILEQFENKYHPEEQVFINDNERWHPVMDLSNIHDLRYYDISNKEYAVMIRNPVERFRSSCARVGCSVEEGLNVHAENVHFWTMKSMGILESTNAKFFKFPDQINECAEYLGLEIPLPILNQEDEAQKPVLTQKELDTIKVHYQEDIKKYEELNHE